VTAALNKYYYYIILRNITLVANNKNNYATLKSAKMVSMLYTRS